MQQIETRRAEALEGFKVGRKGFEEEIRPRLKW
jgi:hypothetical protein